MREWRAILGPFLIWALHFSGVYAAASLADIDPAAGRIDWRMAGLVLSAIACLALVTLALAIRSRAPASPLARRLGLSGCIIGLVAVIWQSLPLFLS